MLPSSPLSRALILTALVLPLSSASAQDSLNKDIWTKKMMDEQRVENKLCGEKSFLVMCTTEYTDPETKEPARLDVKNCREAATMVVKQSLANGNPAGAFYLSLPTNIGAGYQMDHYAGMLGDLVGKTLVQAVKTQGGSVLPSPKCMLKQATAFKVKGN